MDKIEQQVREFMYEMNIKPLRKAGKLAMRYFEFTKNPEVMKWFVEHQDEPLLKSFFRTYELFLERLIREM